jgi:hypothetical protein
MTAPVLDRVEFTVEDGKIGEFVRATLTSDPVHSDISAARRAGFATRAATPTHVVVAGHYRDQRAVVEALGMELSRVVVGSVRWSYKRTVVAGDHLIGTRRVAADERRTSRDGSLMRLVTLETEYLDVSGVVAVSVHEVLIERGAAQ